MEKTICQECNSANMEPKHLRVLLLGAPKHFKTIEEYGIHFQLAFVHSVSDTVTYWNCENIPKELPDFMEIVDIDPIKAIGFGLSEKDAQKILDRPKKCLDCGLIQMFDYPPEIEKKIKIFRTVCPHKRKSKPKQDDDRSECYDCGEILG